MTQPIHPPKTRVAGRERKKSAQGKYPAKLLVAMTIRLDQATIAYFKKLAEASEIPYPTLINLHLRDCASSKARRITCRSS